MTDLPPSAFGNRMAHLRPDFNWNNWRQSDEWFLFMTGYNAAIETAARKVETLKDMGQPSWKVYGPVTP